MDELGQKSKRFKKRLDGIDSLKVLNKIILPSAYLGSTVYYAIIIKHKCIIEANENFNRRSIRNHCNIYTANGKLKLSIPIKKTNKKKITNIRICYKENWQKTLELDKYCI